MGKVVIEDELIEQIIIIHKQNHDGLSPTIRDIRDYYDEQRGRVLSTNTVRNALLNRICPKNNWQYTYRGIETKGEWHVQKID